MAGESLRGASLAVTQVVCIQLTAVPADGNVGEVSATMDLWGKEPSRTTERRASQSVS